VTVEMAFEAVTALPTGCQAGRVRYRLPNLLLTLECSNHHLLRSSRCKNALKMAHPLDFWTPEHSVDGGFTYFTNLANHCSQVFIFRQTLYMGCSASCRVHKSLNGKTPAMAARLTDHVWTVEELLSAQI
jgi:hypothetical protein